MRKSCSALAPKMLVTLALFIILWIIKFPAFGVTKLVAIIVLNFFVQLGFQWSWHTRVQFNTDLFRVMSRFIYTIGYAECRID